MTAITYCVVGVTVFLVRFRVINYRGFAGAGDFGGALLLARNVLAGNSPYAGFTDVPYPVPAGLIALPFSSLDDRFAASLFIALSCGLLAAAIVTRTGQPWRLLMFLSLPFAHALEWAQWSPLVAAAWYLPVLAPLVLIIKPQVALPVAMLRTSRAGLALAGLVFASSVLISPDWPARWLDLISGYEYIIPMLTPWGFLLASLVLNLRDEKARLLLAMSILPARGPYDLLPLFLFPGSAVQMILMVVLSWALPFRMLHVLYLAALSIVWLRSIRC